MEQGRNGSVKVSSEEGFVRLVSLQWTVVPVSAKTTWIFLSAELESGARGWGEATAFGQEHAVVGILGELAHRIKAERPSVHGQSMALIAGRQDGSAMRAVRAGLEQALHDAVSRNAGVTLATLLGGPHRSDIATYANINRGIADRSPQGFASQARAVTSTHGYRAIKIAPFDGVRWGAGGVDQTALVEKGVERVRAVRDAVGSDIDILVDCHARFDVAGACRLVDALAEQGIYWLEEPVNEQGCPVPAMRHLRSHANAKGVRLAGAENLTTLVETRQLIEAGYYDVFLPDLRHTGLLNGMAILRLAAAHGVGVSLHNPVGPVLDAVSQSVAAAMPEFLILERQVEETPLFGVLGGDAVQLVDGRVVVSSSVGHGCTPSDEALDALEPWRGDSVLSFAGMTGAGPDA